MLAAGLSPAKTRANRSEFGLRPTRAGLLGCGGIALGLAALGAGLAVLWWCWAPSLTVFISPRGALVADEQPEQFIAADGRYALIVAVTGVLAGVAAWCVRRLRGPLMLLALVVGSFAGSYVMWLLGEELGTLTGRKVVDAAALGENVSAPIVELNALGLLFLQPLLIVLTYVVCTSWSSSPDLRSRPAAAQRRPSVESGDTAATPPAEPSVANPEPPNRAGGDLGG